MIDPVRSDTTTVRLPWTRLNLRPVTLGILLTVVASVSFSVAGFTASQIVGDLAPGLIVAFYEATLGIVLVSTLNVRSVRGVLALPRVAVPWILLAGGGLAMGVGSFYTALLHAPLSVAAPIVGMVPLVSYAFVLLVLRGHERITSRALVGAGMVVAGVVVIAVNNT